jgi:hypothetical protein
VTAPGTEPRGGQSVVVYRLGGREYPQRVVPNCNVCASRYRYDVERAVAGGQPFAAIVRALPDDAGLSARSIANHSHAGHMPYEQEALRRVVERRAEQLGRDVEDGVEQLVDQVSLAQTVVQQVFTGLAAGELRPDVTDGLRAAKLLAQIEAEGDGGDKAAWTEAFMVYHSIAKRIMSPEQWAAFGLELSTNPVLRALTARYREEQEGQTALAG